MPGRHRGVKPVDQAAERGGRANRPEGGRRCRPRPRGARAAQAGAAGGGQAGAPPPAAPLLLRGPSHQAGVDIRSRRARVERVPAGRPQGSGALRQSPRYIPCAVACWLLPRAAARGVGAQVHVAVNGGYRSPSHKLAVGASPTCGPRRPTSTRSLDRAPGAGHHRDLHRVAEEISDDLWIMPTATSWAADDHIHLELGYLTWCRADQRGPVRGAQAKARLRSRSAAAAIAGAGPRAPISPSSRSTPVPGVVRRFIAGAIPAS